MRRGYYEDLRIVNENLRTSFRFPPWPLAGIFAEDFLEHFGLHQVLEGEVSKPRFGISCQHFAVFDRGFLCNPAIDIEHVLRTQPRT
jgi:hypothetical protein